MLNPEVAIIGAGPYGLSIAAHLGHRGMGYRIFGVPLQNWRQAMPRGMYLKSDGAGSSLPDPEEAMTLGQYCSSRGLEYGDHGTPIALETFVDYALAFQQRLVPDVESCAVVELSGDEGRFELLLDTGERMKARRVVLAVGTSYFAQTPAQFSKLPRELVSHSRDHADLAKFAGREVVVIGGGQSALETAALLHEQGATVQVLVRADQLAWNPPPEMGSRNYQGPQTALGAGWRNWFYCRQQRAFQVLPLDWRSAIVKRALGPAGEWWLKDRVLGRFPVHTGHAVRKAEEMGGKIQLSVARTDGGTTEMTADHVIAATGYKVDLSALTFLERSLLSRLRRERGGPALASDFQSSVGGLYFTGLASALRFGPSMRFVFGAEYAAKKIANSLGKTVPASATVPASSPEQPEQSDLSLQSDTEQQGTTAKIANPINTSVAVLVLNLGEYPFHQGSLGVIRSLGSLGIPVYTVQRHKLIPSSASRYLKGKFLWKAAGSGSDQFLQGMTDIGKSLNRPTILVPADDLSSILIAEHSDLLPEHFAFARPPAALPRSVANKRTLYELCVRLGVACPNAQFPQSSLELMEMARIAPLPVVVKVVEPWLAPKGAKSTMILTQRQDLIDYCQDFVRRNSTTSLMIQEMIPSETSEDWFVHGYFDSKSNPREVFTGMKLRSYPAFAGPTTLARSVRNDALRNQAIELLTRIGYRGIMDLDYRLDTRDGRYKLLDFNPRIGAQFRLFKSHDGTDVVRALYFGLTGQALEVGLQIEGRKFLAEVQDLLASRTYWKSGALTFGDWWRSMRAIDETAWYSAADPLPFLLMCLHLPFRAALRARGLTLGKRGSKELASFSPEPTIK